MAEIINLSDYRKKQQEETPEEKIFDAIIEIFAHAEQMAAVRYLELLSDEAEKNQNYLNMCEKVLQKEPNHRGLKLLRGRIKNWLEEYQIYTELAANTIWTSAQSPDEYYTDLKNKSGSIQWTLKNKYLKYDDKKHEFFVCLDK